MALQIRVSVPEFSSGINFTDPIILQNADNIVVYKSVNSSEEGISFSISTADPKIGYVTYTRWWECWDTETNERINYGPITSISNRSGDARQITGPGRSYILTEFHKSLQTFYYPIAQFFDNLRFENVAAAPSTRTLIDKTNESKYYGLSKRTKDNAIDEQTGYIAINRDTPERGTIKTTNFWAGTGQADWLTIDLGEAYKISKAKVLLPWWGGVTLNNNRAYDWSLEYSADNVDYYSAYATPVPNRHPTNPKVDGVALWMGETGFEVDYHSVSGSYIPARYWQIDINDTHAWYGSAFSGDDAWDNWGWECNNSDTFREPDGSYRGGGAGQYPSPVPAGYAIPHKDIGPDNDCYASAVEIELLRKIIDRDYISNLFYAQIENNNRAITYYHAPQSSEMVTTDTATIRKFEPGTTFRKVKVSWSGAGGTVNIKDEYDNIIKSSSNATEISLDVECPHYSRFIQIEGVSNSQVTYCDAWQGKLDPFSYGGSYSYTTVTGDYFTLRFRGKSLRWYSTVPSGSTAAQVEIKIRTLVDDTWSSWTVLEASKTLPTNIRGELVYEITEDSGILADDTTYQFRVTLLNSGYLGLDSFTGYWSASYVDYNENADKMGFRNPSTIVPKYDSSYSGGTIHEFNGYLSPAQSIIFTGDRVVITSLKTYGAGTATIGITKYDPNTDYGGPSSIVSIPGGNNGDRHNVNLTVASGTTIPQYVLFDSNDFWDNSIGMPWDTYLVGVYSESNNGPVYVDGFGVHEVQGLSVKFLDSTHLDMIKSVTQAMGTEWDITEAGLRIDTRIGSDKWYVFKEGTNTIINVGEVQDAEYIASRLVIAGGEIEGIPLTAVVEDKVNKELFGRTIQKSWDQRSILDYFTLIGIGRVELRKRRTPQRRITITHTGNLPKDLQYGDSVIVKTRNFEHRVRLNTVRRLQSKSGGTTYEMEATEWPQII